MAVHYFRTEDAEKYGIEEAIVLYNVGYWCTANLARNHNIRQGNVWTFNALHAYVELFPYLCPKRPTETPEQEKKENHRRLTKLGRIFKSLTDQGALITGNFNVKGYDRTKWYALANPADLSHYGIVDLNKLKTDQNTLQAAPQANSQICDMVGTPTEAISLDRPRHRPIHKFVKWVTLKTVQKLTKTLWKPRHWPIHKFVISVNTHFTNLCHLYQIINKY